MTGPARDATSRSGRHHARDLGDRRRERLSQLPRGNHPFEPRIGGAIDRVTTQTRAEDRCNASEPIQHARSDAARVLLHRADHLLSKKPRCTATLTSSFGSSLPLSLVSRRSPEYVPDPRVRHRLDIRQPAISHQSAVLRAKPGPRSWPADRRRARLTAAGRAELPRRPGSWDGDAIRLVCVVGQGTDAPSGRSPQQRRPVRGRCVWVRPSPSRWVLTPPPLLVAGERPDRRPRRRGDPQEDGRAFAGVELSPAS